LRVSFPKLLTICWIGLLSGALPALGYHPQWRLGSTLQTSTEASDLILHDFNGDGRDDLLIRTPDNKIQLALVEPGGTIGAPVTLYTGTSLGQFILGDFDGNGALDVIAAEAGIDSVVILPFAPDTGFGEPIVTALGVTPNQIAMAHTGEDSHADLVVYSFDLSAVVIFTGKGDGAFDEVQRVTLPFTPYHIQMEVGDFDADGHTDFFMNPYDPLFGYQFFYGRSDGDFDPVSFVATGRPYRTQMIDLDDDGDYDIVSARWFLTESDYSHLVVYLNLGSRNFAAPVNYPLNRNSDPSGPYVRDFAAGDFDGDGALDLVISTSLSIVTMLGNGNGSFRPPRIHDRPTNSAGKLMQLEVLAASEMQFDVGFIELQSAAPMLGFLENLAGRLDISASSTYPVISVGQPTEIRVVLQEPAGVRSFWDFPPPYPTGLVSMIEGESVKASAIPSNRIVEFDFVSGEAGEHPIEFSFAGDDEYHPATTDAPLIQKVVSAETTVVVSSPTEGEAIPYGKAWEVHATVTSPIESSLNGRFWGVLDGNKEEWSRSGPPLSWSFGYLSVGTHDFQAKYEGNATQPPSISRVLTQAVRKANTTLSIEAPAYVRYGASLTVRVNLLYEWSYSSDGETIEILSGTTVVGSVVVTTVPESVSVSLSPRVHYLRARYGGSTNFASSISESRRVEVLADQAVNARAIPAGSGILITASVATQIPTHFVISRRVNGSPWSFFFSSSGPSWVDEPAQPNTVYAYRIEAVQNGIVVGEDSDIATTVTFTNDPLKPGDAIEAQQFEEILSAVNLLRSAAGLAALSLPEVKAGGIVRASTVEAIRSAINEARSALGVVPFAFRDLVAPGQPIRARDIQDLRDAIR